MKIKARKGFSGAVSMRKGEIRDIRDKRILEDLLKAGYVEALEEAEEKTRKKAKKSGDGQ